MRGGVRAGRGRAYAAGRPDGLVLGSSGTEPHGPADIDRFFGATWRCFQTADRDFAHPTLIQGDWTISGVALRPAVRDAVYRQNAAHLLDISPP